MATNLIYPFAADVGANVQTDAVYFNDSQRIIGNQIGVARSIFFNKACRQSAYAAAALGKFITDQVVVDTLDSDPADLTLYHFIVAISVTSGFGLGTKMAFFQAAAPLYWEKDTLNNDKMLRAITASGAGGGGIHDVSAPPTFNHAHNGASHIHTGPAHTHLIPACYLSVAQMPNHAHYSQNGSQRGGEAGGNDNFSVGNKMGYAYSTDYTGGNYGHGNDYTGTDGVENTGADGNEITGGVNIPVFTPKYIDVIICVKV